MKKNFKVKVNDSLVYELNSIDSNNLDYLELSESNYHVLLNKKSFSLKIDKANFLTKEYTVSVNSNSYNVKIENNFKIDDLTFKLKPLTYKQMSDIALENYTLERQIIQIAKNKDFTDNQRDQETQKIYNKMNNLNFQVLHILHH